MSELEPTRTYSNLTATDVLRRLLDERGVEWSATVGANGTIWTHWDAFNGQRIHAMDNEDGTVEIFDQWDLTPEQAIAATLGSCNCSNDCTNSERTEMWVSPTWERWHKSLRHDEIKSIGDAVEQLMYEVIEFGGDMGPNGNTYNGIDEGDVLTAGYINEWVERFENMLGTGTCHITDNGPWGYPYVCSACGASFDPDVNNGEVNFCPNCGRRIVDPTTNYVDVEVAQ